MYDYSKFLKSIAAIDCEVYFDEPMKKHTSFKIGGPADLFLKVNSEEALTEILKQLNDLSIPFFILGNGTNILVSDKGICGVVIKLSGAFKKIENIGKNLIKCGSGVMLAELCLFAKKNSLKGTEFLWGIPGTIGGALYMNAGAFGGEMKDVVKSCTYLTRCGKKVTLNRDEMGLSYRKSRFADTDDIITSVVFELEQGNQNEIESQMSTFLEKRKEKQPLAYPNAGSIFKKPEGHFAGALIENCGLKGKAIGGAVVSEKHAGFIVNTGNATCSDVMQLVDLVKNIVYEKTNVPLECEVKFVGDLSV